MENKIIFSYMREPLKVIHTEYFTFYNGKRCLEQQRVVKKRSGGRIFGVLCAQKIDGNIYFGYSMCHSKSKNCDGDKYNKEIGKKEAIKKMNENFANRTKAINSFHIPSTPMKYFERFVEKVNRYYK